MQIDTTLNRSTSRQKLMLSQLYPWLVWAMGASFFFYKYLLQVSPSVMTNDLMKEFHVNGVGLGNLSASYFYAYLIMQIPVGILLDKFSPRYTTSLAIMICGLATLLFSSTHSLFLASLSRALIGLGAAFAAISLFKLTAIWFSSKRFALVSGMCMTAAMLGAIVGQFPLAYLVSTLGWRVTLYLIGFAGLFLSILYFTCVKDKKSTTSQQASPVNKPNYFFRSIFVNKQAWLLSLYSGLAFAPVSVFGGLWGIPFIEVSHDLSNIQASFATSFIFVGFALGAPLLGYVSDVTKRRKPVLFYGPLTALLSLCIVLYVPHIPMALLVLALFIFGFGASGFFTSFAMIKDVFPVLLVATTLGFMNTFDSVCEAVTEPLVGALLDTFWRGEIHNGIHTFSSNEFKVALTLLPLFMLIAICLLKFIKETHCLTFEENLELENTTKATLEVSK